MNGVKEQFMFKVVELNNFRGFDDAKLSSLSRINVITGLNGAGKTTLLEAVFLLCSGAHAAAVAQLYGFRGEANYAMNVDRPFKSIFKDLNTQVFPKIVGATSELMIHQKKYRKELTIKPRYTISSGTNSTQQNSLLNGVSFEFISPSGKNISKWGWMIDGATKVNPLEPTVLLGGDVNENPDRLDATFVSPYFKDIAPQDHAMLTTLIKNRGISQLIETLKIINPNLVSLHPLSDESGEVIYADVGTTNLLPLSVLGAGLSNCLHIILPLILNKNAVILFDEFENGLHHSLLAPLLEAIFKMCIQNNNQIFITTHSNEFLTIIINAAKLSEFKDLSFYRLSRKGMQGLIPRYSIEEAQSLLDANMDIR